MLLFFPGTGVLNNAVIGENNARVHAEVNAFKRIKYDGKIKKIDLLVIRVNNSGRMTNSRPCYHCMKYMTHHLYRYKIRYIYYSTDDGIVCHKFKDLQILNHISRGRYGK